MKNDEDTLTRWIGSIWMISCVSGFLWAALPALAHDGFEGILSPLGGSCCGANDCGPTETRFRDGKLQAHITRKPVYYGSETKIVPVDLWVDVPPERILPAILNPLAGPSVCWLPHLGVLCFFPGHDG